MDKKADLKKFPLMESIYKAEEIDKIVNIFPKSLRRFFIEQLTKVARAREKFFPPITAPYIYTLRMKHLNYCTFQVLMYVPEDKSWKTIQQALEYYETKRLVKASS